MVKSRMRSLGIKPKRWMGESLIFYHENKKVYKPQSRYLTILADTYGGSIDYLLGRTGIRIVANGGKSTLDDRTEEFIDLVRVAASLSIRENSRTVKHFAQMIANNVTLCNVEGE